MKLIVSNSEHSLAVCTCITISVFSYYFDSPHIRLCTVSRYMYIISPGVSLISSSFHAY